MVAVPAWDEVSVIAQASAKALVVA